MEWVTEWMWLIIATLILAVFVTVFMYQRMRIKDYKDKNKYLNSELNNAQEFVTDMFFQAAQEQITGRIEGHKPKARKLCRTCPLPALVYRLMDDRDYDECEAERRGRWA